MLPVFLAFGIALLYTYVISAGHSFASLQLGGWLFNHLGGTSLDIRPILSLRDADWGVILNQAGSFAAIALTSVISILLNFSAMEIDTGEELDMNRELRITGLSNILAGSGCGMVGFGSLGLTRLGREFGARTRWSAFVVALLCGACFVLGTEFITYIPKFVLGGLLLEGYIFFGSANNVIDDVKKRLLKPGATKLEYVIFDFRRVAGLDSSAILALMKLRGRAVSEDFVLIFCCVTPELDRQMARAEFELMTVPYFRLERDRDHALEWCENDILDRTAAQSRSDQRPLEELFETHWPANEADFIGLLEFSERRDYPAGEYLMLQGDDSDDMFFIERGRVSACLELQNGQIVRLRTMGPGTVFGELGLYLNEQRTASIVAEEDCKMYRLSRKNLNRMQRERPDLAAAFHYFMLRVVSERLVDTNKTLQAVLD